MLLVLDLVTSDAKCYYTIYIFRLMMSSPLYGSSFFSRTTSGRSNQSYQTWSASLTPLSQTFYPYQAKSFSYEMGAKPPNAPMMAWNSTPSIKQPNGLPPLRQSPKVHKKDVFPHRSIPKDPARSPPTKWLVFVVFHYFIL